MTKTTKTTENKTIKQLKADLEYLKDQIKKRDQTIETYLNRIRTVEGERNAMRQMARFARLSQMDVGLLNSRFETIEALLRQSTKLIDELKEPKPILNPDDL
jgi:hypothetical protein